MEPWRFTPPPGEGAYSLLLITLASIPREEKLRLAAQIIASDARSIACWGVECEDWHDTLDWAYLASDENFNPPDERFVMTSWHENESLAETVFYLWFCGIIDDNFPTRVGIFILGDSPDIRPALEMAVANEVPGQSLLNYS
jgi:hypothetical protein